jgi:MFS superfamily sulfate permease-like transporter
MNFLSPIAKNLKDDLRASIMVFFVALPLCLGVALASGAPLFAGVIAGIVGGVVVGALSGSQLGVSGPAAGLTVIVLAAIVELGSFDAFLVAVVLAGLLQLALGFLKAGIVAYYFPSSVIKGMLAAIGIIIFLKQIPHAFGYDAVVAGYDSFKQNDGHNTISSLYYMLDYINLGAVIIAATSLAILLLWDRPVIKRIAFLSAIPGSLIAVIAGIVLVNVFAAIDSLAISQEHLVNIPVPETPVAFFESLTFPDFGKIFSSDVWLVAITLAAIASIETLLCLEATDKLDPQKRVTSPNRELKAQGVGNIVSGLIGGLPVTQVIVRSSANIQGGAKTKISTIFHGLLLLISVMFLPQLLNMIPLASLAAILMVVGYKLASPVVIKAVYKQGKEQFIPFVITVAAIIFTDLLTGIGIGMLVAVFHILYVNYLNGFYFNAEKYQQGDTILLSLTEHVTFINKASIIKTLNEIPDNAKVIIDGSQANDIDYDVWEIIQEFELSTKERGIELSFKGSPLDNKINRKYNRVAIV